MQRTHRVFGLALSVCLTMCGTQAAPVATVPTVPAPDRPPEPAPVARSPAALAALLAAYDSGAGNRAALAGAIDHMAGQEDAVTSRLYWYTDLDEAKAEAKRTGRPILSLRLLGKLDQEMSCANSRLFRVVLYANPRISAFLRDTYVLHWSSERAVPQLTLDFGDGRVVRRTITGNSVHYVLDSQGRVVDALPGLYGPAAFERGLRASLALARESGPLSDEESAKTITRYHTHAMWRVTAEWRRLLGKAYGEQDAIKTASVPRPVKFSKWPDPFYASIPAAEVNLLTESKADMEELPLELLQPQVHAFIDSGDWWKIAANAPTEHLDPASRALIRDKHPRDWTTGDATELAADKLDKHIERFEARLTEEELRNEYVLHSAIHRRLTQAANLKLTETNDWIYAHVFMTPRSDAWLGLRPTEAITAILDDGIEPHAEASPPFARVEPR